MEWIRVKDRLPDPQKEQGWYVVLIKGSQKPHCIYFEHTNWEDPWRKPAEWNEVTHYIRLHSIPSNWDNDISSCVMD